MSRQLQNQLLNFIESGRIKVDEQRKQYNFAIKGAKVFATCNEINRLSKPLQSRFRCLHLPKYSREQFLQIAVKVCPKLSEETALIIAEETWEQQGDIRDLISWLRNMMAPVRSLKLLRRWQSMDGDSWLRYESRSWMKVSEDVTWVLDRDPIGLIDNL
jgi:hypothetical protein